MNTPLRIAAALVCLLVATNAEAKQRHHKAKVQASIPVLDVAARPAYPTDGQEVVVTRRGRSYAYTGEVVGGRPPGCPHAYCGCGVSLKVFGWIIPELNLAANWIRKFPRTSPAAGMVAARNHHVFYIESVIDSDTVVAYDPNSGGHRTRVHTVSIRGYRVVNPHGSQYASN